MRETPDCPISGTRNVRRHATVDYVEYDCPVCGKFRISRTALKLAGDEDQVVLFDALQVAKRSAAPDEVPMVSNLSG